MGFLDSVTGFLGKVADGVTHAIAPNLDWKPSSLIQHASKLLPSLAEAIPGVGPFISKALPAVQAIFGGSDKTTSTPSLVVPGLEDIKKLLENSSAAAAETKTLVEKRFNNLSEELKASVKDITEEVKATVEGLEKEEAAAIASLGKAIEKQFENLAEDGLQDKDERLRSEKSVQLQTAFTAFHTPVSNAIAYLKDKLPVFNEFTAYGDNTEIRKYLGEEGSSTADLQTHRKALSEAVLGIKSHLTSEEAPTQEILDLYVLAIVWLLIYDKTLLTLRSYLAHSLFNSAEEIKDLTEYIELRRTFHQNLDEMIRAANDAATFLLGSGKEPGFIDALWDKRQKSIKYEEYAEKSELKRNIVYFYDTFPRHGLGVTTAKFNIGAWRIRKQYFIVVKTGDKNAAGGESDLKDIRGFVQPLHVAYVGLQKASYDTVTRAALEAAQMWRLSASHWRGMAPLDGPPDVQSFIRSGFIRYTKDDTSKLDLHRLDVAAVQKAGGYVQTDVVRYAVSYVTSNGEGRLSSWTEPIPFDAKPDSSYIVRVDVGKLPLGHVESGWDSIHDAAPYKASVATNILRRVYVKNNNKVQRLIDLQAPAHQTVIFWDLGGGKALLVDQIEKPKADKLAPGELPDDA